MAVQVEVKLVCDRCAGSDRGVQRATRTRRWGLDGTQYEVEVCDSHSDELDELLNSFLRVSRKAGTKPKEVKRQARPQVAAKTKPEPVDRDEFLLWASMKGYNVKADAKRLPGPLVKRFRDEKAAA